MKKMLVGLAALIALGGTAFAGNFADTLHYPLSPRVEDTAMTLDYSPTGSIKPASRGKTDAPAVTSSRVSSGDSASSVPSSGR